MFGLREKERRNQRGQAVIIFVLASTVIFGALALALDIGQAYVVRRHAQNIADQAALVGAQQLKANPSLAISDAIANAAANGVTTGVTAVVPPGPNAKPEHRTTDYIEVTVQQQVPTFFAGILRQGPTTIVARAVAKGRSSAGYGAIIALSPETNPSALKFHCNSPGDLDGDGNADPCAIVDGGVWSNGSLVVSGNSIVDVIGTAAAVGGIEVNGGATLSADAQEQPSTTMADPLAGTPLPTAPGNSTPPSLAGWTTYTPGTYDKIDIPSGEKARFLPGVYVVTGNQGVKINGTAIGVASEDVNPDLWSSSQWDEPQDEDSLWGPVHFYVQNSIEIASTATVRFQADEGTHKNIVFWSKYDGNKGVKITGGANVALIGTVYAPKGMVELEGGADVPTVRGQVIANRIEAGGTSTMQVVYNPNSSSAWQKVLLVE